MGNSSRPESNTSCYGDMKYKASFFLEKRKFVYGDDVDELGIRRKVVGGLAKGAKILRLRDHGLGG